MMMVKQQKHYRQLNLQANSKMLYVVLVFLYVVGFSCKAGSPASQTDSYLLTIKGKLIDTSSYKFEYIIHNNSNDSIVFPITYAYWNFSIDSPVTRKNSMVSAKRLLPSSNFYKLSKKLQTLIKENNCRPYVNDTNYKFLGPRDSMKIIISAYDYGYSSIKDIKKYTFFILSDTSLRHYCPCIWVGKLTVSNEL
jgi:hypothetical protein